MKTDITQWVGWPSLALGFVLLLWGAVKAGDPQSKMGGFLMGIGVALLIGSALVLRG